jgi:3-phosphoshikimate 1-carboxyvinyltransferase
MKELRTAAALRGTVTVPGSKSATNRALICAALAPGESTVRGASDAEDVALMKNALDQLGVAAIGGTTVRVHGRGGKLSAPKFPIPVGNAGTTLRFLLALSAIADGRVVIQGNERMAERPNDELVAALRSLGVRVVLQEGTAQFAVSGGRFEGGAVRLSAHRSSQFLSALLLVAPCAERGLRITLADGLSSRAYVEMTRDVMLAFGVEVEGDLDAELSVAAGQRYRACLYDVEPDASSATYPWAAAAITGGEVLVPGTSADSLQADIGILKVLEQMGSTVLRRPEGIAVRGRAASHDVAGLRGVDVDMNVMPDAVPTVVAAALFASSPTRIRNVAHLRHKESDRLGGFADELRKLGADIVVYDDGLEVRPVPLHGAEVSTLADHRLAMSFALVGTRVAGIRIDDPDCVRKSFPAFWESMGRLEGWTGEERVPA